MRNFKNLLSYLQHKFKETTVDNIIWWINLTLKWVGISILTRENSVLFWTIHFALLFYMNFGSNFVYRILLADDEDDIIKANTNLSLIILAISVAVWFFTKRYFLNRKLLISSIERLRILDSLSSKTDFLSEKHNQLIKKTKMLVLGYYMANAINIFFIWIPQRMDLSNTFYTSYPCPGLDVSTVVNKYICRAIIFGQDTAISLVIINYQSLMLFFVAYTAGMYDLLSEEMVALDRLEDTEVDRASVEDKLTLLIKRHSLLLKMVQRLRNLYNTTTGVALAGNAYCMCLFFILPLDDWFQFLPLLSYCFIVYFLYCFLGQKLIDSSIVFERSVYLCGWEKFMTSDKKSVFIILMVSQRTVMLLAGEMIPVNMNTFASAVQFMYKLVMALKF